MDFVHGHLVGGTRFVVGSEVVLQTELHVARPDASAGDLTEVGGSEAAVRVAEDGRVGGVLRFHTEFEALSFLDTPGLQQRRIERTHARTAIAEIPGRGAERVLRGLYEGRRVEV